MAQKGQNQNSKEPKMISFHELTEARKQELEHVLPGFYSVVRDPNGRSIKEAKVYAPPIMKRTMFKISED
jgi:hypothetical protein